MQACCIGAGDNPAVRINSEYSPSSLASSSSASLRPRAGHLGQPQSAGRQTPAGGIAVDGGLRGPAGQSAGSHATGKLLPPASSQTDPLAARGAAIDQRAVSIELSRPSVRRRSCGFHSMPSGSTCNAGVEAHERAG